MSGTAIDEVRIRQFVVISRAFILCPAVGNILTAMILQTFMLLTEVEIYYKKNYYKAAGYNYIDR